MMIAAVVGAHGGSVKGYGRGGMLGVSCVKQHEALESDVSVGLPFIFCSRKL